MFYKPRILVKRKFLCFILPGFFFLGGCIHINMFERQAAIPAQEWKYDFTPQFNFEIKDTTSRFLIYVTIRHTDLYQFNNLWLKVGSRAPGDSMRYQNINLQLATKDSWEGTGMDDIYEVRKLISPGPVSFRKAGDYVFTISQIMRENPLKFILNAGIRIEKVE